MSEESVILVEDSSSSQADLESVVRAAVFPSPFDAPEGNVVGERGEGSPVGGPEGPTAEGGVCETEFVTKANVEDGDVDVVGGVDEVGVTEYESEVFPLSKILHRKRLAKKSVSECVVDTAHLPQCEFSNLQNLTMNFLLEVVCWPVTEFY